MKQKILVIGSSNTDMVIKTQRLPGAGETIIGGTFFMNPGGKGANQAVAAARLGGDVIFIGKIGKDIFGRQSVQLLEDEGINTQYIFSDQKNPSGIALITVDENAENCIVVAPGANATLTPEDLQKAETEIAKAAIILMQLEIPVQTVAWAAATASAGKIKVILNPAPACALPEGLLQNISIITPNESEAEMLTGIKVKDVQSAVEAGKALQQKGVQTVIITLGKQGAMVITEDIAQLVPAPIVQAVDTTAAGDIFNGALAIAIAEGLPVLHAVSFACNAAAVSVTRMGAQASAPYRIEINTFSYEKNF